MNLIFTSENRIEELKKTIAADSRMKNELTIRAEEKMKSPDFSVTHHKSPALSGDIHDYFSEGPYWWPDPSNPDGPYIRRDGEFNPDRFNHHANDLRSMAEAVAVLCQAGTYLENRKYFQKAASLIGVWFLDEKTRMNPNLNYAQAIRGICAGRGIGIIDTAFLLAVINGANLMDYAGEFNNELRELKSWFAEYSLWLQTSKNGLEEKEHPNNHSNWWNTQVAAFCAFSGNNETLEYCFDRFFNYVLPTQTGADGSFTDEISRTRSYHYEIYNLDASALICEIAHHRGVDLWNAAHSDGRGMKKSIEFFKPYYENPFLWKHEQIAPDCLCGEVYPMKLAQMRFGDAELERINFSRRKNIIPCALWCHLGMLDLI